MHSRNEDTAEHIDARVRIGNVYINRNQIGAVVGVQPFGGQGLSGTGPRPVGRTICCALLPSARVQSTPPQWVVMPVCCPSAMGSLEAPGDRSAATGMNQQQG
ncbi:aldehyde dehydrogenase family protein [Halopseudomonas pachastrellae]|nr:aldehyde dehydrogenase family protein [Halopseudomonas pachastrellae]